MRRSGTGLLAEAARSSASGISLLEAAELVRSRHTPSFTCHVRALHIGQLFTFT